MGRMKPCCKRARMEAIAHAQMLLAGVATAEPEQNYRALVLACADMLAPLKEPPKPMRKAGRTEEKAKKEGR